MTAIPVGKIRAIVKSTIPLSDSGRQLFFSAAQEMIKDKERVRAIKLRDGIMTIKTDFKEETYSTFVGVKFLVEVRGSIHVDIEYIVSPKPLVGALLHTSISLKEFRTIEGNN